MNVLAVMEEVKDETKVELLGVLGVMDAVANELKLELLGVLGVVKGVRVTDEIVGDFVVPGEGIIVKVGIIDFCVILVVPDMVELAWLRECSVDNCVAVCVEELCSLDDIGALDLVEGPDVELA